MLKILSQFFLILAWVLLGMGLALFFYRKHLCCDKDADMWYYLGYAIISFCLSVMFDAVREDDDKDA